MGKGGEIGWTRGARHGGVVTKGRLCVHGEGANDEGDEGNDEEEN